MMERVLDRCFRRREIVNCERDLYLVRWYVFRSEGVAVFVHRFVRSDEDRALHDHPWDFLVIPVWRGYREHSDAGVRRVRPLLGARFRRGEYRHRVELLDGRPAWSVFVRFRRRRMWGFWPGGRFINWKKWWNDLCED